MWGLNGRIYPPFEEAVYKERRGRYERMSWKTDAVFFNHFVRLQDVSGAQILKMSYTGESASFPVLLGLMHTDEKQEEWSITLLVS